MTQFYHGAVFPDGKRYLGGTQDNGTLLGSDENGANRWSEIFGGDGGYVAVDPANPNNLFVETTRLSIRKSTDGGRTFGGARFGINEPGGNFLFITPFAMDPSDPQRLWIGGKSLWRSTNGAANWQNIAQFNNNEQISAVAVAPSNSSVIAVGSSLGCVAAASGVVSPALHFTLSCTVGNTRSGYVSSVTFDPLDSHTVYATYSTFGGKHIWRSRNRGDSWLPIDGEGATGLPDVPVHGIAVDPTNTSRLFAGTDLGVFVSNDGGANWAVENTGFPNTVVESLAVNTADGVTSLYAFTHGRGAWRVALNNRGCNISLNPASGAIASPGGEGRIAVAGSPAGCGGAAESNEDWLAIKNNGSGNVTYQVAPNTSFYPPRSCPHSTSTHHTQRRSRA